MNQAFVINLDTQLETFLEVQQELKSYGIQCQRHVVTREPHKQISCTMTHLALIAEAKKKKWPYLFIIEDDCISRQALQEWPAISKFLLQEKDSWDIFLGGILYPWPKKLVTHFKNEGPEKMEIIECSHGVTAHFIIYNQSSYDRMLKWHELPMPLVDRCNIDNLFEKYQLKIWVPSPFVALQKPHSNSDWTKEFERAEKKLQYFSMEVKKSLKYRLLHRWLNLKTVS